jgi:hypothetical protein
MGCERIGGKVADVRCERCISVVGSWIWTLRLRMFCCEEACLACCVVGEIDCLHTFDDGQWFELAFSSIMKKQRWRCQQVWEHGKV